MTFKALAFDLDDTLIDTSGLLVPLASRAAYVAMTNKGLKMSYEIFDQQRKEKAIRMTHKQIFFEIAESQGDNSLVADMAEAGIHTFYHPPLPPSLPLLAGAAENLRFLKDRYTLFLVTSGAISTQKEKVKRAGLESHFQSCIFVDGFKKERKRDAFLEILRQTGCKAHELLSIGNRLSQEIHDAKEVGAKTCYFEYGEHVGEQPRNQFEIPDFKIHTHHELVSACRL